MSTTAGRTFGPPMGAGGPVWSGPVWQPMFGNRWAWIAIMILGFAAWWPLGLAMLFLLIGSGRMRCGNGFGRRADRDGARRARAAWSNFCGDAARTSGNRAFDEYRAETLRRLEEEQREFATFLERLRFAKDKSEFDAFMTERRQRPESPPEPGTPA